MDGKTLRAAMEYPGYPAPLSLDRYDELATPCEEALVRAGCTTTARAAMFLAQIGAESGSLRWTQELADGTVYDRYINPDGPWRQLGNTRAGDGARFKGRSFIQITGRAHYTNLSKWAHSKGYVPTSTYFVDHPERLASDRYAFLGPVWYWTVARNMNKYADADDIEGATRAVNGGLNNLAGRGARWHKCLTLGDALLPDPGRASSSSTEHRISTAIHPEDDMATIVVVDPKDCAKRKVPWPGWFLTNGFRIEHIDSKARLDALRELGLPTKKISVTYYRALGGK